MTQSTAPGKPSGPDSLRSLPRSILIVDPDPFFLEAVRADPLATRTPPTLARNGKEAQTILAEKARSLSGIFLNFSVRDPIGISVVRAAHQHRPGIPLFEIRDGSPPFSEKDLKKLGIRETVPKPLNYAQLLALAPPAVSFDGNAALELARQNTDLLDAEVSARDAEFIPLRARDFMAGSNSHFDVYVRLDSGRYVKILKAGDAFTQDRISSYLEKGVRHFYIRREVQEYYLKYCDKLAGALLEHPAAPTEIKLHQTLHHGEQVMTFLRDAGLNEAHLKNATNFVNHVGALAKKLQSGNSRLKTIESFLSDVVAYEHGVATTMLTSLFAPSLQMENEQSIQILGLASLLHDIGLDGAPPEVQSEDPSQMNHEQKALYLKHPEKGSAILAKVPRIHPTVIQAVLQHHERRTKKGFPVGIGVGWLNPVAEVIGLCDEYVRLITRMKDASFMAVNDAMRQEVLPGFSTAMGETFSRLFEPLKSTSERR